MRQLLEYFFNIYKGARSLIHQHMVSSAWFNVDDGISDNWRNNGGVFFASSGIKKAGDVIVFGPRNFCLHNAFSQPKLVSFFSRNSNSQLAPVYHLHVIYADKRNAIELCKKVGKRFKIADDYIGFKLLI